MTVAREDLPYRSCAGIMLVNGAGLVFTGERLDTPGAWQMPQGGIDDGESPRQAALRELEEEIGVRAEAVTILGQTADWVLYDLPDHLLGKVWQGRYRGQKQMWFLMRLDGDDSLIDIATHHPEFGRWRWTPLTTLVEDIVPFKRAVYQAVVDELGPHIPTN